MYENNCILFANILFSCNETGLYVCMYVYECMYVCMNVCTHVQYVCICLLMYIQYVCVHACMHRCIYLRHVCMYVCMYVIIYVGGQDSVAPGPASLGRMPIGLVSRDEDLHLRPGSLPTIREK